jgi:hypothetical protein
MATSPVQENKNPTELLSLQLQTLERISQIQLNQNSTLEDIRVQQEELQKALITANQQHTNSANNQVEIIDFNMPFTALVGILVKIALASIPAAIILTAIIAVIGLGIVFILGAFGVVLTGILGR